MVELVQLEMNVLLLLPLVLAGCWCSVAANDCNLTARIQKVNQEGTTGPRVVNAVLDAIECSGVFEDDHRFMRRLAYVETSNGVSDTYTGIWGNTLIFELQSIDNQVLNANYSTLLNQIQEKLGIDVLNTISDFEGSKTPLVSGVLARVYLHIVTVVNEQSIPPAGDICGQAIFWDSYYKRSAKSVDFILHVNQLEGKQCIQQLARILEYRLGLLGNSFHSKRKMELSHTISSSGSFNHHPCLYVVTFEVW